MENEPRKPLLTDVSVVRAAILDVVDSGTAKGGPWRFDESDFMRDIERCDMGTSVEDAANGQRLDFCDAVTSRIAELQSSLHILGVHLENYCTRHRAALLPTPSVSGCPQCIMEREK